jgi:hypothetical protein
MRAEKNFKKLPFLRMDHQQSPKAIAWTSGRLISPRVTLGDSSITSSENSMLDPG